jgi:type I restriction enzyme R subunit
MAAYTQSGGKGETTIDQEEAVAVMLEKYEVCCGLFHGFDCSAFKTGTAQERLAVLPAAQEHILAQAPGGWMVRGGESALKMPCPQAGAARVLFP